VRGQDILESEKISWTGPGGTWGGSYGSEISWKVRKYLGSHLAEWARSLPPNPRYLPRAVELPAAHPLLFTLQKEVE